MSAGRSAPGVRIASLADIRDAQASPIDVRVTSEDRRGGA